MNYLSFCCKLQIPKYRNELIPTRNPQVCGSPLGAPLGLSNEPSSPAMGVPVPSPGCSGLQLSRYRLERLRKHLCLPSSRSHTEHASPHPESSRPPSDSAGRPVELLGDVDAVLPAARLRPPPLTDDTLPVLRSWPILL